MIFLFLSSVRFLKDVLFGEDTSSFQLHGSFLLYVIIITIFLVGPRRDSQNSASSGGTIDEISHRDRVSTFRYKCYSVLILDNVLLGS